MHMALAAIILMMTIDCFKTHPSDTHDNAALA